MLYRPIAYHALCECRMSCFMNSYMIKLNFIHVDRFISIIARPIDVGQQITQMTMYCTTINTTCILENLTCH